MIETSGNILDYIGKLNTVIVIPTNLCVDSRGEAIMGAGIAKTFADLYPLIPKIYGNYLKTGVESRFPGILKIYSEPHIVSFPTKGQYAYIDGILEPGWKGKSKLKLIVQSAYSLVGYVDSFLTSNDLRERIDCVILPKVGCGHGGLSWEEEVKPVLASILTSNIYVVVDDNIKRFKRRW